VSPTWTASCKGTTSDMTTTAADVEALRGLVRRRRMYFEVAPELLLKGSERLAVGYELRLWAVHAYGARALPGCPKCGELRSDLRRIASWALVDLEIPTRIEIQPADARLYASVAAPGSDEVALTIRLLARDAYDSRRPSGATNR